MAEKIFNSRIIHKHDVAANWSKATNFVPKQGEIIVYDIDADYAYERIKIGDGSKNVNALPFVDDALRTVLVEQINAVDDKVDAVSALVGDTSVASQISTAILGKVDKVDGKSLSTNDYTTVEKNKLAGIADGAEVNVQSDWNQNDETADDYIKNRVCYKTNIANIYSGTFVTADIGGVYGEQKQEVVENAQYLVNGGTYTLNVNGELYNCVAIISGGMIRLGNQGIVGGTDTGEPFIIQFAPGYSVVVFATKEAVAGTYEVTVNGPMIKTIDREFIPALGYVTSTEVSQNYAPKSQFNDLNSRLTYKGLWYSAGSYTYFMYFLTNDGLWHIQSHFYDGVPAMSKLRMNYASDTGTLELYRTDNTTVAESIYFNAYLYNVSTGEIIQRATNVQSVTIGAYTKKSHNIPFYINKTNPQLAQVVSDFNDFVDPVVVDDSLSLAGAAADAKATGDAIAELNSLVGDTSVSTQISDAIADLVNGAPTTLDTLGEIASAMEENADVVTALDEAIGSKANASDLTSHIDNQSNPHNVTLGQLNVTATAEELNHVGGVTGNIQTQLDGLSVVITDDEIDAICGATLEFDDALIDEITGTAYKLYVSEGNLKMTEVTD